MKRLRICWLAVWLNLALAVVLHAAPGDLDRTFAGTGMKRLRFGFGDDYAGVANLPRRFYRLAFP